MGGSQKITVYQPSSLLEVGLPIWKEMSQELLAARGLVWRLILRDVKARYSQSFLGLFWAFLAPLFLTMLFVWVRSFEILPIRDTAMPYVVFVFLGQLVWLLFANALSASAPCLVEAGPMVGKIFFPREVLIFSAVGQVVFEFAIRIPLLVLLCAWTGFWPDPAIFFLPLLLFPLVLMVLGIGFWLALLNTFFRDISHFLTIILGLGMFGTPVVYPSPELWPFSFVVNFLNPVSVFVTSARDLALLGRISDPVALIYASLFGVGCFLLSWRAFHLVEPKLAERV